MSESVSLQQPSSESDEEDVDLSVLQGEQASVCLKVALYKYIPLSLAKNIV